MFPLGWAHEGGPQCLFCSWLSTPLYVRGQRLIHRIPCMNAFTGLLLWMPLENFSWFVFGSISLIKSPWQQVCPWYLILIQRQHKNETFQSTLYFCYQHIYNKHFNIKVKTFLLKMLNFIITSFPCWKLQNI